MLGMTKLQSYGRLHEQIAFKHTYKTSIKTNLKLCHKTQYILIFCIKYLFNIVPFRVIQSKLFQGIVIKEVAEFKVKHDMFFCIKYLFRNVSFRKNQLKSCREL